jgi:hypothetical protein
VGAAGSGWLTQGAQTSESQSRLIRDNTIAEKPGSIILMHDGGGDRSQTIEPLRALLPTLVANFHLQPMPTTPQATADRSGVHRPYF